MNKVVVVVVVVHELQASLVDNLQNLLWRNFVNKPPLKGLLLSGP